MSHKNLRYLLFPILCWSMLTMAQTVSVYATGLNNPRGLKFGPNGNLYVAEGGAGGALTTSSQQCEQVSAPIGPYTGGFTARISMIDSHGTRTTVADHLPSSSTDVNFGGLTSGVGDVAFVGKTLYGLLSGAGCSHGLAGTNNGVVRVDPDGTWNLIANLSSFQKTHPVANPELDDFEPDGTWFSMVSVRGSMYAVDPNHGELDAITPNGEILRIADISATQGHIVPTAVAYHGNFYVGNLLTFPIQEGGSKILKITPSGTVSVAYTGFTTILGLAFDHDANLYVLENTTGNAFPTPNTGKVLKIDGASGAISEIATGLFLPTAMTVGPDDNLYVSNVGFGPPPVGLGEVLKITIH